MTNVLVLLLACGSKGAARPCECDGSAQTHRETGDDSTGAAETGHTGESGDEPDIIIVACTSPRTEVDLGIVPGEPPPRFAAWGYADPTIEWIEVGYTSGWVLLDDLSFTAEGMAIIPCQVDYYRDPETDTDVTGYVYNPFTIYIWR